MPWHRHSCLSRRLHEHSNGANWGMLHHHWNLIVAGKYIVCLLIYQRSSLMCSHWSNPCRRSMLMDNSRTNMGMLSSEETMVRGRSIWKREKQWHFFFSLSFKVLYISTVKWKEMAQSIMASMLSRLIFNLMFCLLFSHWKYGKEIRKCHRRLSTWEQSDRVMLLPSQKIIKSYYLLGHQLKNSFS